VDDKRLMVRESEFAGVLKAAARETNTLTAIIRRAWDSPGLLQTMTKNSPARASNPHVSIVGHITQDELTRLLNTAEAVNGFLNRFLIICVRRSKLLPEGGAITTVEFGPIHRDLCAAVAQARTPLQVQFDASGRQAWNDLYYRLADPRPGLVGAITARAEAHCLRLSLLYALLDRTTAIGAVHVRAAEAVWNYADASAVHLFGDRLGNPLADELLARLRQAHAGLTRTEISGLFSRNRSREALSRTLEELATRGLARMTAVATDGRPAEVWHATRPTGISDETNERDEKRVPSRGPEASKDLSDGYETNEEDERRLPSVDAGDHGTSESVPLVHHASDEAGSAAARPQEFTL